MNVSSVRSSVAISPGSGFGWPGIFSPLQRNAEEGGSGAIAYFCAFIFDAARIWLTLPHFYFTEKLHQVTPGKSCICPVANCSICGEGR